MVLKVKTGEQVSRCQINFPENSLHPNKLITLAREMVWASRFFNIEIATFSPMLIEAIDAWSEQLQIDVEFYLNELEINQDYLYEIYEDLSQAYDEIDILRLKSSRKQEYCSCCYQ